MVTRTRQLERQARGLAARMVDPWVRRRAAELAAREPADADLERAIATVTAATPTVASNPADPNHAALRTLVAGGLRAVVASGAEPAADAAMADAVVDAFHDLYYRSNTRTWLDTRYRGVPIWKCPLDLWLYQEILDRVRPSLIVETGSAHGGSGYFLGDLVTTMGLPTRVVSIDIAPQEPLPVHDRVTWIRGSSVDEDVVAQVREIHDGGPVLVILDSDHSRDHVLAELRTWGPWVTPGSYVIVEDTNVNGHPTYPAFGPGPMEALDDYLAETDEFTIDASQEKFFMTFNPRGYLVRT